MDEHKIREVIDACRPGSDDLHWPEFAAVAELVERDDGTRRLYERTQRTDAAFGAAFQDVDVPDGLAQRLLAAVATRRESVDSLTEKIPVADPLASAAVSLQPRSSEPGTARQSEVVTPASRFEARRRFGWKRVTFVGGSLAVVAAIAFVAIFVFPRGPSEVSQDELAKLAIEWTDTALQSPWNPNLAAAPAMQYPVDSALRASAQSWQPLRTRYDSQAVVYSLAPIGQPYVLQVTVRTNQRFAILASPPSRPFSTTGGVSIGAWQREGVLYVLIVEGDERRYQSLLKPPPSLAGKPSSISLAHLTGKA